MTANLTTGAFGKIFYVCQDLREQAAFRNGADRAASDIPDGKSSGEYGQGCKAPNEPQRLGNLHDLG